MAEGTKKELLLAAYAMARPDLLTALSVNPERLASPTAAAIFKVLLTDGPTYAAPGPMLAALQDLSETVNADEVMEVFSLIPEPASVELGRLLELKSNVVRNAQESLLVARIHRADDKLQKRKVPTVEVVNEVRAALLDFSTGAVPRDPTSKGILARMRTKPPVVRYRVGIKPLDDLFKGIDKSGEPTAGMAGRGQIVVVLGGYKRGKTREVLNWNVKLLKQGCSVGLLVLEDDESTYATKLMATMFDLPPWQIERYIFGLARIERKEMPEEGLLGYVMSPDGGAWLGTDNAILDRLKEAVEWFEGLGERIRIYEGESSADYNVYRFDDAIELMSVDCALYGTEFWTIDYVQQFATDYEEGKRNAYNLRAWAGRNKVGVFALSQMPNDALRWGSSEDSLDAKGNGEWGAVAHIGIEIERDPAVGDQEFALWLKVARNGPGRRRVYVQYNTETGKALKYYETPEYMELPNTSSSKPQTKGKGRK